MTSGVVPDLFPNNPVETLALYAWDNKLVDVSDVVETQKSQYTETALLTALCYNSIEKRRSYYAVPFTCAVRPNHVWRPLIEKAGYNIEDAPKTWDAYYDFFKEVHKKLRAQGMRKLPARHSLRTGNFGVLGREIFSYPDVSGSALILCIAAKTTPDSNNGHFDK